MKRFHVSAPGKLHLLGEHSVVFGRPAIIAAVNRRSYALLTPITRKEISISANTNLYKKLTVDEILKKTEKANDQWKQFSATNNPVILKNMIQSPRDFIGLCIGETLKHFNKTVSSGFSLDISCNIPIGSGMGSSAAVAVSIVGAISLYLNETFNKDSINTIAYAIERKKHGFPSGGDNTTCCYGGFVWYQKISTTQKNITQLDITLTKKFAEKFLIIQTGIPDETTGEMVSMVKDNYQRNPETIETILNHQSELVKKIPIAIQENNDDVFMDLIREGERNLNLLGVVSKSTQELIKKIESCKGVAKICGGGGQRHASGIVLAFHPHIDTLKSMLAENNIMYSKIELGEEGVRLE